MSASSAFGITCPGLPVASAISADSTAVEPIVRPQASIAVLNSATPENSSRFSAGGRSVRFALELYKAASKIRSSTSQIVSTPTRAASAMISSAAGKPGTR